MSLTTLAVRSVRLLRKWLFRLKGSFGTLRYGRNFIVGPGARLERGVSLLIGDRVNIGAAVTVQTNVTIGDDVMISSGVSFIGDDHDFGDPSLSIQDGADLPKSIITLEGDNLIGYGTIVLGPVTVGRGSIVGAGSLVTRDLPPDMICVGRPAVPIRPRR